MGRSKQDGLFGDMPFNQQMTVPSELTLHSTFDGPCLRMNPITELETLRAKRHDLGTLTLKEGHNALEGIKIELLDLEVEFKPEAGSETIFDLRGIEVAYDADSQILSCGEHTKVRTKLTPVDGLIRLRVLLDRTSIEVYGNDGRVYIPLCVFPKEDNLSLGATCSKGEVKANYIRVYELKSAWE